MLYLQFVPKRNIVFSAADMNCCTVNFARVTACSTQYTNEGSTRRLVHNHALVEGIRLETVGFVREYRSGL